MKSPEEEIFKKGSTTYYFSSKFLPKDIRQDVFRFYSFVRTASDYVDAVPQKADDFQRLRSIWNKAQTGEVDIMHSLKGRVVGNMLHVRGMYNIDNAWITAFLNAMQSDLDHKTYKTLDDSLDYVYGSAEVIGLMMSKIMNLPVKVQNAARYQGRAMQWLDFILNIAEDNKLGRCYFPAEDLKTFGLKDLSEETAKANQEKFTKFVHFQISRYKQWQTEANKGFKYTSRRLRIPLRTAVDMYEWSAQQITDDPMIIFRKKIRPRKRHILTRAVRRMVLPKA